MDEFVIDSYHIVYIAVVYLIIWQYGLLFPLWVTAPRKSYSSHINRNNLPALHDEIRKVFPRDISVKLAQLSLFLQGIISEIGNDSFCEKLAECGQKITGCNSTVIVAFLNKEKPFLLYSNLVRQDYISTVDPYFEGAYLLDPIYEVYKNGCPDNIYRLKDIAPKDFESSEYYQNYYRSTGIVDEIVLLIRISNDICIDISFGLRNEGGEKNQENDTALLEDIFPVFVAAVKQNWARESQLAPLKSQLRMGGEFGVTLDVAFANFGKDYLSPRECEIVRLILKGYTSDSIADMLGISRETVKVYRKRIHSKLSVNSSAELFSLFLEAISTVPLGMKDKDPLNYYYNP
jgi:DNA-binding CsgD family transcriptional regulator